jgi:hypothetical protein
VVDSIVDRVARKYATEYSHGLFHGSTSPSNIEVTGRALDHGPMTALDGFTKAINVDDSYNGDLQVLRSDILFQMIDDLRVTVPEEYRAFIPSKPEVRKILKLSYDEQVQKELLWRFGLPPEMVEFALSREAGKEMADLLLKIGKAGNDKVISTKVVVPKATGTYDLNQIIYALSLNTTDESLVKSALSKQITNTRLMNKILLTRENFLQDLKTISQRSNMKFENLTKYIELAGQQRNRSLPSLMRGPFMYVRQYIHIFLWTLTRLAPSVSSYVDGMVAKSSRNFETFSPSDLVLQEIKDYKTGSAIRRVYDGTTGKTKIELVGTPSAGQLHIFNSEFAVADIHSNDAIEIGLINKSSMKITRIQRQGNRMVIQLDDSSSSALGSLKSFRVKSSASPLLINRCSAVFM